MNLIRWNVDFIFVYDLVLSFIQLIFDNFMTKLELIFAETKINKILCYGKVNQDVKELTRIKFRPTVSIN